MSVGFWSFVKFWVIFGAVCGFLIGVLTLISTLFGADVTADVFGAKFEGTRAGAISLVWVPLLLCPIFLVVSPIVYFPFRWALRMAGGLLIFSEHEDDSPSA